LILPPILLTSLLVASSDSPVETFWKNIGYTYFPPKYEKLQDRKYDGRWPIFLSKEELVTRDHDSIRGKEVLRFYTTDGHLFKTLTIPKEYFEPEFYSSEWIIFYQTAVIYDGREFKKLPPIPGAVASSITGFSREGNFLAAWTDMKPIGGNQNRIASRFAIYKDGKWTSPPVPAGYLHAYPRGMTDTGIPMILLSNQEVGNLDGYLLRGFETTPEGGLSMLQGKSRFYVNGKYVGADPPILKNISKHYQNPEIYPCGIWGELALYEVGYVGDGWVDVPTRMIPYFLYKGKWFTLDQILKTKSGKKYRDFGMPQVRGDHILFREYTDATRSGKKPGSALLVKVNADVMKAK
jgi:hypothetical protein